ncbi:MAG: hypothetical protein K2N34_10465 [Lachnospiraceae bacterium]|nr:hypothetical protein [Lachnospiraceae bacterium]
MRKLKIGLVFLITTFPLMVSMGCGKNLRMDTDKCAAVALEYLESKYQTEFEVVDSTQIMRVYGPAGYAEVTVSNKFEDTENEYLVTVYPDGSSDDNKDGYYDLYQVISDDYMSYLLEDYARNEMDKLLIEAGFTRFISSVGIGQMGLGEGSSGFSADFPILNEESFSLKEVLDNSRIKIHYWIKMSESEYSDILQDRITSIIQPLLSDDLVTFSIDVYENDYYSEIEDSRKNEVGYNAGKGINRISFSVKEEDEDESK